MDVQNWLGLKTEIGKKHPLKLFLIFLDPALNGEVHLIQSF